MKETQLFTGSSGLKMLRISLLTFVVSLALVLFTETRDSLDTPTVIGIIKVFLLILSFFLSAVIICIRYENLVWLIFEWLSGTLLIALSIYIVTYNGPESGAAGESAAVMAFIFIPGTIRLIQRLFGFNVYSFFTAKVLLSVVFILLVLAIILTGGKL